jgi:PAS domain S-box-containing protein
MAVLWPPSGLLLAALLLAPRRRWAHVVLAALPAAVLASVLRGRAPPLALGYFAGNALEAVAGAWLVLRFAGPRPSPATVRGALALATLPAAAAGVIVLAVRVGQVLLAGGTLSGTLWMFWGGSSLGALVVAPLLLAFAAEPPPRRLPTPRQAAAVGGLCAALALGLVAFARYGATPWPHEVVLVPPLVWATFRFGVRGATAAVAVTAVAVARLHPPDPSPIPAASAQVFLALVVVTVLFVTAASEERRRATADLARSRDLLESFFAQSPTGMFIKDERHRARVLSRNLVALLGARVEELLDLRVDEMFPGPFGEELLDLERAAVARGAPTEKEIRLGDRTFLDVVFPIPRAEGPPYVGGLAVEVTDRVRAEAALRASEERLRLIEAALDQASDAVWILEHDGRVLWANAAQARFAGVPKERLVGASLLDLVPGLDAEAWRRRWEETAARGVATREETLQAADGRLVPAEVASAVVEVGGRRYHVSSARDVSDRRRAEAAARLAGIGTLAAGDAHEINNPLAYVVSNLAWLHEQLAGGDGTAPASREEALRVVEDAQDGAVRVRGIVQHLRLFARPDETVGPVDVRAAARSAIILAQNELARHAALVTRFGDLPPVLGNENRLAQVFLHLLTNATHAIPAGRADRETIVVDVRAADGGERVIAEVSDTGRGIAPEIRERIFEPFFTTKAVGAGSGLGLFVCHGIVSGMGGRIEVESTPGSGSTFRVVLPAAKDVRPAAERAPPAGESARRGRVLVLDDDERVAWALRRVLHRQHDVDVSNDPRAALERVRAGESWDVVFCDLMMPGMTGMDWFDEVCRSAPALAARVVFMTGGAFTDAAREFLARVENARVEKPFAPDEIRALVSERVRE